MTKQQRHVVKLRKTGVGKCSCGLFFPTPDASEQHAFEQRGSVEAGAYKPRKR